MSIFTTTYVETGILQKIPETIILNKERVIETVG